MKKIYIVRLSEEERQTCHAIIKKLKGSSEKVRRANILLKADADGPNWKDQDIADAFLCSRQTVENVRKRLVTEGFDIALNGKQRGTPPRAKSLDGRQEAEVIALRFSEPPEGRNGCVVVGSSFGDSLYAEAWELFEHSGERFECVDGTVCEASSFWYGRGVTKRGGSVGSGGQRKTEGSEMAIYYRKSKNKTRVPISKN